MTVQRALCALTLLTTMALSTTAEARPYRFPDPIQFGIAPIGFQMLNTDGSTALAYRAGGDVAYRVGSLGQGYMLWVGLGGGYSPLKDVAGSRIHDVRVDLFGHLAIAPRMLESASGLRGLRRQPLHTYVRAGVSDDMQFVSVGNSHSLGLRLGAGVSYFFSDHVGWDLNLGGMVGFGQDSTGALGLTTGGFDVQLGLRFGPGKRETPKKKKKKRGGGRR